MLDKLQNPYKKRFKFIALVVLPICFLISLILNTLIAYKLNYVIDRTGFIIVSLSLVPLYFLCLYWVYQTLLKMPLNPQTVGFPKEWDDFFKSHPNWAKKYKALHSTLEKIFIREFEPENAADKVVFFLGRLCVEDFNEIFLLCANGYGLGGLKILRGLYERTVTAGYISKCPNEAELFLEYHFIHKRKMLNHAKKFFGNIEDQVDSKEIEDTEQQYRKFKDKFNEPICKKCKTYRIRFSWSSLDLLSMAKKAELNLDDLYFPGYFFPTLQTHATPSSLMSRLKIKDNGTVSFDEGFQRGWAERTLVAAHNILLRVMLIQEAHFNLGFDAEIKERGNDFMEIWGGDNGSE